MRLAWGTAVNHPKIPWLAESDIAGDDGCDECGVAIVAAVIVMRG